jgi:hypothetical protein
MFSSMSDDGGNGVREAQGAWRCDGGLRLAEAAGRERRLLATCGCGEAAAIDAADWIEQGLGPLRLSALEGRLRCACGARQVRLAAGGAATRATGGRGGAIHVFR